MRPLSIREPPPPGRGVLPLALLVCYCIFVHVTADRAGSWRPIL